MKGYLSTCNWLMVAALTLSESAYLAEIYRGGLLAIPQSGTKWLMRDRRGVPVRCGFTGTFVSGGKPDDAWLAKQENEPILEPELPIIDTHHHLWDRGGWTYLLPELLADLNTGHNIVVTVFEECRSMYRANGPVEMRPILARLSYLPFSVMSSKGPV